MGQPLGRSNLGSRRFGDKYTRLFYSDLSVWFQCLDSGYTQSVHHLMQQYRMDWFQLLGNRCIVRCRRCRNKHKWNSMDGHQWSPYRDECTNRYNV